MNTRGMSANLVPSHPANGHAVKHGIYSRTGRVLAPRAETIAAELLNAPHVSELDAIAAEELGAMIALAEAIDAELAATVCRREWNPLPMERPPGAQQA